MKSHGGTVPRILQLGSRRRWMVGFKTPQLYFRCKSKQLAGWAPKVI